MSIKHPVLKYYGSKFRLAQWIIGHFPEHRHYVEPFGGGASILLVKEPSRLETYNDLDKEVYNFFKVLRENPIELIQQITLTPWSRIEYEKCLEEIKDEDPTERARRLFFRLWMNFQGSQVGCKGNWRRHKHGKRSIILDIKPFNLFEASQRLLSVQLENRDAFKLMREFDSEDTLFYLDPPYVLSTRTTKKGYNHEMTNENHQEFAELLYSLNGFVVLSGYPSKIYEELFENRGWKRVDKEACVLGGGKRTECLWLSPKTSDALLHQ